MNKEAYSPLLPIKFLSAIGKKNQTVYKIASYFVFIVYDKIDLKLILKHDVLSLFYLFMEFNSVAMAQKQSKPQLINTGPWICYLEVYLPIKLSVVVSKSTVAVTLLL